MISEKLKGFIEEADYALVASADQRGRPHLAASRGLRVPDSDHILFEAWFCRKTMENVADVPRVAIVILDPGTGSGYQLAGLVENVSQSGILNGFAPELEAPGMPQVQWRMVVRIDEIVEFSTGAHSDRPLSALT